MPRRLRNGGDWGRNDLCHLKANQGRLKWATVVDVEELGDRRAQLRDDSALALLRTRSSPAAGWCPTCQTLASTSLNFLSARNASLNPKPLIGAPSDAPSRVRLLKINPEIANQTTVLSI